MAEEYFGIRLDTDKLEQDAQRAQNAFDGIAEQAVKAGQTVDNSIGKGAQDAAGKFNMLNISIQQIARELPSLAISPGTFFLAISNNFPMLTDALAQAREENNKLVDAGEKAIPVFKQVGKALFSWQTALSLIPALLVLFGDDILVFFEKVLTGSKKVDMAAESLKAFRDVMAKGTQNAQKEITEIRLLYNATQDITEAVEDRKKAVDELQRLYPDYFGNLSDEEILAGKAADAYDRLTNSIISNAKAEAARKRITEEQTKVVDYGLKIDEAYAKLEPLEKKLKEAEGRLSVAQAAANLGAAGITTSGAKAIATSGNVAVQNARSVRDDLKSQVEDIYKEIEGYRAIIRQADDISIQLESSIKVSDLIDKNAKIGGGDKQAIDNLKQYLNELLGLQEDNEERRIEIEKKGADKEIALIELRYKRQIDVVKKLQEELKKEQGGTLTEEQQSIFSTAISGLGTIKDREIGNVKNKQIEAEKKAMQDYLAEYGDYWEKRKAIAEKYQDEIEKATTKGQKLSLQAEMTEALAKLDDEAQKKTSIITKLFGNMATKSVSEMRKIADEAEQFLEFIEGGEYQKDNAFGITEEQFKVLSQSPEKLESIKNEIANVRNEADKAEPTFERIKDLLEKIFERKGSDNELKGWLNDLNGEVAKVLQSVSFLSNSFANLGDAFGSDVLSGVAEGLNVAMDAVNSTMQGAQAGAMFGPIGAAAGAAVGAVTSLASSIAKIHDKQNEREIQRLQDQIDALSSSYDRLGKAVEEAYSKDASNLIQEQNRLLEQQKVLIENQIKEEQDKKKTDEGRIKEWEQQLEDINEQIEENKEKAVDAIFGEDIQSAIDRFSSSVTDMWASNTNASQSARDAVRQMMQEMVTESIKSLIKTSGKMEEIRKQMQEFYADSVFSGWEQDYIYNMADELQNEINNQFGWAEDLFKDKTSQTQTATGKGFETMTQDQASELNGTFTALYEVGLRQEQQINIGNVNLEAVRNTTNETRDLVQSCYLELTEIRENTGAVVKPIQQMQKDMQEMNKTIKERL